MVLSGAGVSTPSGIPDFRSEDGGLWGKFDPMEVASLSAFRVNPEKFYEWIRPLVTVISNALPNPAHDALARLEQAGFIKAIITQNIDGLHQQAGSREVYEVHGSVHALTCGNCFQEYDAEGFLQPLADDGVIPLCKSCGHVLKPNTILFQEQLPIKTWQKAEQAIAECDLIMVIGSSVEVLPVAALPVRALNRGAELVIINNSPTYVDERAAVVLNADVASVLPEIAYDVLKS